jgi:hypothetical protein
MVCACAGHFYFPLDLVFERSERRLRPLGYEH